MAMNWSSLKEDILRYFRCFTLADGGMNGGVRVEAERGLHPSISPRGEFGICVGDMDTKHPMNYVPFVESYISDLSHLPTTTMDSLILDWAALTNDGKISEIPGLVNRSGRQNRTLTRRIDDAMLLVMLDPGRDGRLIYSANCPTEHVENGRVVRPYNPFPSPGIEVIGIGGDACNVLITMLPGSSFRVYKTGDFGDLAPGYTVIWNGRVKGWKIWARDKSEWRRAINQAA